jgi:hypothetical protein
MPIIVNLDVVLAQRKMRLNDLAEAVDITPQNLSILKTGNAKAIRFLHARGDLRNARLPAGRNSGIPPRGRKNEIGCSLIFR